MKLRLSEMREARWLPTRCSFASFRLLMILLLARSHPTSARAGGRTTVYVIDRHQSALENYSMAILLTLFVSAWEYVVLEAVGRPPLWLLAASVPVLVVLASFVLLVIAFITSFVLYLARQVGLRKREINNDVQSSVLMILLTMAATAGWLRGGLAAVIGACWAVLLLVNGLAALTLLVLEPRVRRLDEEYGGATSVASS